MNVVGGGPRKWTEEKTGIGGTKCQQQNGGRRCKEEQNKPKKATGKHQTIFLQNTTKMLTFETHIPTGRSDKWTETQNKDGAREETPPTGRSL